MKRLHPSSFGMKKKAGVLLCVFSLLLSSSPVRAQNQTFQDVCAAQINDRLSKEQRLYRRVLFGMERANKAQAGDTRYDTNGIPWMKVATNRWQSQAMGMRGINRSDSEIDAQVEHDSLNRTDASTFRAGLFSAKRVTTSDIIPSTVQNFRALQCRAEAVCEAAFGTLNGSLPTTGVLTIATPGCRDIPVDALSQCGIQPTGELTNLVTNVALLQQYCKSVSRGMIDHEAALLKFSVSYDAAHRSLLQFSGNFDNFLSIFTVDLLTPIRQSQILLQQLGRAPCFLSACHE